MEDESEHRGTKRNNGDDDNADDPFTLWERLQESQRKKMKLLKDETEKLQKEKDIMNSVGAATINSSNDGDIIIEINAGGKIIEALRSTLTLVAPDTMFSYMFSGRWEESLKRDRNGRVFIDENSELIEIIVDFLRMKKREDPSKPAPPPTVQDDKKDNFLSLLNYYGLTEFFYPTLQLDITNIDVVQLSASIDVIKSENKIQFSANEDDAYEHEFAICQPPLDSSGEGAFWKVTIDHMESNSWLFFGNRKS
jgi:preprotein translocase subunit YajC